MSRTPNRFAQLIALAGLSLGLQTSVLAHSVDEELLKVLLGNGAINQQQHDSLLSQLDHDDADAPAPVSAPASAAIPVEVLDQKIALEVAEQVEAATPVKASHGSKGFRLETADGNWQTNLQWRGQFRYTNPSSGDPRQLSAFNDDSQSTFEARRLRMKIGGHGFQPWLKYYFEVDLQPSRDTDDGSSSSSARVIDWRADIAKWDWGGIRLGQWKIDYNRERVDSSGRQQFVERSIVNRVFTVDRQVGVQLRGHAFKNTAADLRWYLGAFTGEGRGVRGTDDNLMYIGRLQWNMLGRDVALRQTDVEYTELPSASLGFAAATTQGSCTRWSSSGCGNLDGFARAGDATADQFKIEQAAQDFAFKWRGWSIQQELHHKEVTDRLAGVTSRLTGGYLQSGYFFHNMFPSFPEPLELALRYAYVEEPNATDLNFDNERTELTLAANWFFAGHNNKITFDISRLTLDDDFFGRNESENRARLQWDVSF
ncbi:MAG: porin [Pseudomonadales bacterium]